jgi:hypothetical protein
LRYLDRIHPHLLNITVLPQADTDGATMRMLDVDEEEKKVNTTYAPF